MIKRKTKPKAEFPSEQSLDTFFGTQGIKYKVLRPSSQGIALEIWSIIIKKSVIGYENKVSYQLIKILTNEW